MNAPMISVRALAKTFTLHTQGGTRIRAFDGVDLNVAAGECVALHGPSGAGKSSLLRSIYANYRPSSGRVVVRKEGVAWHRYGGTISAKPGKALAIPQRDEVYGVWPSEQFPNRGDAFVWRRNGKAFLVARKDKGVKSGNRTLRILYLLLKSVSKGADTTVLPPSGDMQQTAAGAVAALVRRALARRAAAQGAA